MAHNYYRTPWRSSNYNSAYSSTYSSSYRPPYMLSNSHGSGFSSYSSVPSSLPSNRLSSNNYSSSTIPRSMGHSLSRSDWNSHSNSPSKQPDSYYLERLYGILGNSTPLGVSHYASPLTDYMSIGSYRDAEDIRYLKRHEFTHVLNCAAYQPSLKSPYPPDSGIVGYLQFFAEDTEYYDMMQHFMKAKGFIDAARRYGGKVLVHCAMGVNRSATMCVAYLMLDQQLDLLEAVRRVKSRRGVILTNKSFQKQLIRFAREKDLLKS
ncbi:DgyrCDS13418 [Dimorphilus gyrociliatus]|uniref:protein-tyrosine-phosphatase n=1 Tax=Dimorphilus gyrociliatus TaxID=2664684 RepID=A0A7I8WAL8_9ANNE|nr:DgyrCDS13418 [Dimorphilus gyrociliatus]